MAFLRNLATGLGIIINIILLFYYKFEDNLKDHTINDVAREVAQNISYVQFICIAITFLYFILLEGQIIIQQAWKKHNEKFKDKYSS